MTNDGLTRVHFGGYFDLPSLVFPPLRRKVPDREGPPEQKSLALFIALLTLSVLFIRDVNRFPACVIQIARSFLRRRRSANEIDRPRYAGCREMLKGSFVVERGYVCTDLRVKCSK